MAQNIEICIAEANYKVREIEAVHYALVPYTLQSKKVVLASFVQFTLQKMRQETCHSQH